LLDDLELNEFSAGLIALGYLYQAQYSLLILLQDDSVSSLSIERLDDIEFFNENKNKNYQLKHHKIKSKASLTNHCDDLWRTLRVWSKEVSNGSIRAGDVKLVLVTTGYAPNGSAASKLRPKDGRDTDSALRDLCDAAHSTKSEKIKKLCGSFLNLNEIQKRQLVDSIYVLDSSPNIKDTKGLITHELRYSTTDKNLEYFYNHLIGWWYQKFIDHLYSNSIENITYCELKSQIDNISEQFRCDNLPIDFPHPLDLNEGDLPEDERIFVEQLRLVTKSEPRLRAAISDYYRASRQRSKWLREDVLFLDELDQYQEKLIDEWRRLYEMMKEDLGETPTEDLKKGRGRILFNSIEQSDIRIRPNITENYIMRGSYHGLSNRLLVGWHVDYYIILNDQLKRGSIL